MTTTQAASQPKELTAGKKRLILLAGMMGMLAGNLPGIPITVTMPTVAHTFGIALPTAQWLMTAHFVALAATMLPVGAASAIVGRLRIFIAGFLTLLASVALRAIQGVGAGMVMVTAPAICSASLPPAERGRAIGIVFLGAGSAPALANRCSACSASRCPGTGSTSRCWRPRWQGWR